MLTEICKELRNYFELPNGRHFGRFEISGGSIAALDFLQEGQYFRIIGSTFNDGVYQHPTSGLTNETFDGVVWALGIPKAVLNLVSDIEAWQAKNKDTAESPFQSESLGNYSYTKRSGKTGGSVGWQDVFRKQLNAWRKL